ncbi:hypothetical protein ACFWUP_08300 [Nocardia sp. NPDC058658]|uniref:hypothetical protein n=1 Tax=Nocardia sp. NPDC058658 TaxID=3346580 RepID=UPI0036673F97
MSMIDETHPLYDVVMGTIDRGARGGSVMDVVDWLMEIYPELREGGFTLATVLRLAFGVPIVELHVIIAWVRGEKSRECAEETLERMARERWAAAARQWKV